VLKMIIIKILGLIFVGIIGSKACIHKNLARSSRLNLSSKLLQNYHKENIFAIFLNRRCNCTLTQSFSICL
jgi:hypothetical protein